MKLLLLGMLLFAAHTVVASDLNFTLVNETGLSFEAVYVSASDDKDWDGNLLKGDAVLAEKGQLVVKFATAETAKVWDMNVVDADGVAIRFEKVNLAGADTVTLRNVDGKVIAEVK